MSPKYVSASRVGALEDEVNGLRAELTAANERAAKAERLWQEFQHEHLEVTGLSAEQTLRAVKAEAERDAAMKERDEAIERQDDREFRRGVLGDLRQSEAWLKSEARAKNAEAEADQRKANEARLAAQVAKLKDLLRRIRPCVVKAEFPAASLSGAWSHADAELKELDAALEETK